MDTRINTIRIYSKKNIKFTTLKYQYTFPASIMAFLYYHATLEEGQQWMDTVSKEDFGRTAVALHQILKKFEPFLLIRAERKMVETEIFQNGYPEAIYSHDTIMTQVTTPKGSKPEQWGILVALYDTKIEPQELRRHLAKTFTPIITEIIRTTPAIGPLIRINATAHLRKKVRYNILPNQEGEWCYTKALKDVREEYEMSILEGLEETIVNGNGTSIPLEEGTY